MSPQFLPARGIKKATPLLSAGGGTTVTLLPGRLLQNFRPMDSAAAARSKTGAQKALTYLSLGLIMVVGPANFLLFRILYDTYGSQYAFFVSQGVNFIYCIVGGVALYPRMWRLSIVDRRAAAAATAADAAAAAAADGAGVLLV